MINFPVPSENYYWRHKSSIYGSRFDKYELMKKRRWWFDEVVHDEYVNLAYRYPTITQRDVHLVVEGIKRMEVDNR